MRDTRAELIAALNDFRGAGGSAERVADAFARHAVAAVADEVQKANARGGRPKM